jgi:hypothetical protein
MYGYGKVRIRGMESISDCIAIGNLGFDRMESISDRIAIGNLGLAEWNRFVTLLLLEI